MKNRVTNILLLAGCGLLFYRAALAFEKIASGTGSWWKTYSFIWGSGYAFFLVFCVLTLAVIFWGIVREKQFKLMAQILMKYRNKFARLRFALAFVLFILPIWFFQFTALGVVFRDVSIRSMIWGGVVFLISFLISKKEFIEWRFCLLTVFLTSASFVTSVSFLNVTDYPFSLGWSEGNRMWDYSIMFGSELYNYPADKPIPVLLDVGRQFIGGLPFILPNITITVERFWIALTLIIPYLILGIVTFRFMRLDLKTWCLAALWTFIFLKQGPIHSPLILCAIATALTWRNPLWVGIPLIAFTSYFAEASRFTWVFAPAMWVGMLEFAGAALERNQITRITWIRTTLLGISGVIGGQYGETIIGIFTTPKNTVSVASSISLDTAVTQVTMPEQPLLWYRLLPNETYPPGILFGLMLATLPLIILLGHFIVTKQWKLNTLQLLAIVAPLFAFLVVGFIVSAKIGGGGDLHNMDMFLIGLMFAGALAIEKMGKDWLAQISVFPMWMKINLILFFALPGLTALAHLRSISFPEESSRLAVLMDLPNEKSVGMLPADEFVDEALRVLQEEVNIATAQDGQILFIDQRQLLTFGYITNVVLIPEYEKKVLMNEALSGDIKYFSKFYADLAKKRFSLIISEPLKTPIQDSADRFGEENNAWVKWVSIPVLCYYDIKTTLREVNVQLLVPKPEPVDCSSELPMELPLP